MGTGASRACVAVGQEARDKGERRRGQPAGFVAVREGGKRGGFDLHVRCHVLGRAQNVSIGRIKIQANGRNAKEMGRSIAAAQDS